MYKRILFLSLLSTFATFFAFKENALFPFSVLVFPITLYYTVIRGVRLRSTCLAVWMIAFCTVTTNLYWVALPIHEIGKAPLVVAAFIVCLLGAILALFYVLFAVILWNVVRKPSFIFSRTLFAGTLWVLTEYLLSFVFSGFPWLTLPMALVQWPLTVSLVSVLGTYGLSGFYVFLALFLFESIRTRSFFVASIAFLGWGLTLAASYMIFIQPTTASLPLNIALIQGNIKQQEKWLPSTNAAILQKYITLSQKALDSAKQRKIDLIIWPETALPFLLVPNSPLEKQLLNFIKSSQTPLLAGNIRYGGNTARNTRLLYNSALLFSYDAQVTGWYDKQKLVPFGEYTPFWLSSTIDFLNLQMGGAFESGFNPSPLTLQNIPFGVSICYEILFPYVTQQQVLDGAQFLVTISNDAWFGKSRAAWQHLQHARLRAIEQERFIVRATNTGITAVLSPKGFVLDTLPMFQENFLAYTIYANLHTTIYNAFAPYAFFIFSLLALILFFMQNTTFKRNNSKCIIRKIV